MQTDTAELLQRCKAGDETAIETLVQTYRSCMVRLSLLLLDDPAEAEEAVQDAFLSAFRSLHSYKGNAEFKTWLTAITLNECRGRLRKRKGRLRLKERLQALYRLEKASIRLEETLLQREETETVWAAVQSLDEKHRLPVILRYYQDLPVREIARVLKINEGTVHSRLNTARSRLHEALRHLKAENHG